MYQPFHYVNFKILILNRLLDNLLWGVCVLKKERPFHCADMVAGIVPLAMPDLARVLVDQEVELCQEVVGVC